MGKVVNSNRYDEMLLSLIPRLDEFENMSGSEGTAYFVDDKYIVKAFFEPISNVYFFNEYCKEIQNFANIGLAVPKIYSWCCLPAKAMGKFNCYILEERIQGRRVFDFDLESIYHRCKNFCQKEEFMEAVGRRSDEKATPLLAAIIREYVLEFIETNELLLNMSEENLEKFFESDYFTTSTALFSSNDIIADNVMFDRNKLTIIDSAFLGSVKGPETKDYSKIMMLRDAFILFDYNRYLKDLAFINQELGENYQKLQKQNEEICFEAMRRFVRKANQMYSPIIRNVYDYDACEDVAKASLNKKRSDEICKEIQRQY